MQVNHTWNVLLDSCKEGYCIAIQLIDTVVPVHRHEDTAETVVCLRGRLWEVIYEKVPATEGD